MIAGATWETCITQASPRHVRRRGLTQNAARTGGRRGANQRLERVQYVKLLPYVKFQGYCGAAGGSTTKFVSGKFRSALSPRHQAR